MRNLFIVCFLLLFSCISTLSATNNYDLKNFPKGFTPDEIGERLGWRYVRIGHSWSGPPPTKPVVVLTYPDVCTWFGAIRFARQANKEELYRALSHRFERLLWSEYFLIPPPNHVDNNVFGTLPLELYKENKDTKYLELGMIYADAQWTLPAEYTPEEKAWLDKGYSWQTRLWIDDMFMITTIQSQAYQVTGDRKYIDRAAKEMVLYLDEIQRPNGLFHHAPNAPFFWGRGNGWMAVGMADLLRILPEDNPHRPRILTEYKKMMATLLKYQTEDGIWRQLIDVSTAWKETSSSAMFTYAMIAGVKHGWLDEKVYGAAARKAWLSLVTYINEEDNMREVCAGTVTKNNLRFYLERPRHVGDLHGHAPMLWCAYLLSTF